MTEKIKARLRNIGQQLTAIRMAKDITQVDLAGRLGIGPTYLSKMENGRTSYTVKLFAKWCNELGVEVRVVMESSKG
jgi:transcriptional regulator with XRE-family HTH domain